MADGWERQMSGNQQPAGLSQFPQKTDPNAGRLLGVVFEAVVPIGVFKPDLEHGVAGERQPVAAGRQADHAVPGGVAAGATDDHPGAISYSASNVRIWLRYSCKNRLAVRRSASGNPGCMEETREKSGDAQNSASAAARCTR